MPSSQLSAQSVENFWELRTSEIVPDEFSGTIQQTLVRQLLGLPDLFRSPCYTVTSWKF